MHVQVSPDGRILRVRVSEEVGSEPLCWQSEPLIQVKLATLEALHNGAGATQVLLQAFTTITLTYRTSDQAREAVAGVTAIVGQHIAAT
jgi:hypothetical protein